MVNVLLLCVCNKHSFFVICTFCTCAGTSTEYISQSRAASFTECLVYILLNVFQVSLQRSFPTDIECEDLYSHTQHLKNHLTFAILKGEMFSCNVFCCFMFIDCCRFLFFWNCLFMSFLHLSFRLLDFFKTLICKFSFKKLRYSRHTKECTGQNFAVWGILTKWTHPCNHHLLSPFYPRSPSPAPCQSLLPALQVTTAWILPPSVALTVFECYTNRTINRLSVQWMLLCFPSFLLIIICWDSYV